MVELTPPIITLDGPGGAGKSSVSQQLAHDLTWHFLDSGAIYRSLTVVVLDADVNVQDEMAVLAHVTSFDLRFEPCLNGEPARVFIDGVDRTATVRHEATGKQASIIAAYPKVREALLQRQRRFVSLPGLVAEGRDMGTTVFPEATLKCYLTASTEIRADRRYNQLKSQGIDVSLSDLVQALRDRDARDEQRAISPLRPAGDAVVIDTSHMNLQQVVTYIHQLWADK